MTNRIESVTVADGKYTIQLSNEEGRMKFEALRYGEPWRDMSSDGDNLMLAMFQQLREQQARIDELEAAAREPFEKVIRRWDVEDGSEPALEAEPTYMMKMDKRGFIDVRPQGISDDHLLEVPHLFVAVEINKGVPCLYVYKDALSGEVEVQYFALPGQLVDRLYAAPDIQALGEDIRARVQNPERSRSDQAPTA